MCQTEVIDKIKTHFFSWNPNRSWDNVRNYDRDGQSTDDSIMRRTPFTCRVTKATDTHSECVNTYFFCPTAVVTRTHLSVPLYVGCLSCYKLIFGVRSQRKFLSKFLFFLITSIYWSFSRLFISSKFMRVCYPLWFVYNQHIRHQYNNRHDLRLHEVCHQACVSWM